MKLTFLKHVLTGGSVTRQLSSTCFSNTFVKKKQELFVAILVPNWIKIATKPSVLK